MQQQQPEMVDLHQFDEEEEEETQAIYTAIHNLERLILKNDASRKSGSGSGGKKKKSGEADIGGDEDLFFKRNRLPSNSNVAKQLDRLSPEDDVPTKLAAAAAAATSISPPPVPVRNTSSSNASTKLHRSLTPESIGSTTTDPHSLVNELQRVQEMLGSVLERKSIRKSVNVGGPLTPQRYSSAAAGAHTPIALRTPIATNANRDFATPDRGGEAARLSTQNSNLTTTIKALQTEKKLRYADLHFLERELCEKDNILNDVAGVLGEVEKQQEELEEENARLREEVGRLREEIGRMREESGGG